MQYNPIVGSGGVWNLLRLRGLCGVKQNPLTCRKCLKTTMARRTCSAVAGSWHRHSLMAILWIYVDVGQLPLWRRSRDYVFSC